MNSNLRTKMIARLLKNAKGFTLIELLVVIVIVGVLSAVAVPTFLNQVRRSRVAEAQAGLDVVSSASEVYRFDVGIYPDRINALEGNYFDDTWTQSAPNYQTISAASASAFADGMQWTASADGTDLAYTVDGTAANPLSCAIGLGAQNTGAIACNN